MNTKKFDLISEDIIKSINELDTLIYGVLQQEDNKILLISTNFIDNRNDLIDILLWKIKDDIFLSDYFIVHNEFISSIDNENILNDINKLTNGFPITKYFYQEKNVNEQQLICKTNLKNLKQDLFYFCQFITKYLNLIDGYNNIYK